MASDIEDVPRASDHETPTTRGTGTVYRRGVLGAGAALFGGLLTSCGKATAASPTTTTPEPEPGGASPSEPMEIAMLGTEAEASKLTEGGTEQLRTLEELVSKDGRLEVSLTCEMVEHTIGTHRVSLRSYAEGSGPLGPPLRLRPESIPGRDKLRQLQIDVQNDLPTEREHCHNHEKPNIFNDTNMHTHGLHVSPREDDIFRRIQPTYNSRYAYNLKDHPGGTHWYHPHVHGSTAMQVASGMSGLLIIEGEVDTLAEVRLMDEKLLIFNQIMYATRGEQPYTLPDFAWLVDSKNEPPQGMTINGQVRPVITMKSGEVQRWRLVHSGFRDALRFDIQAAAIQKFAADGINFAAPITVSSVAMGPGNRVDLFVRAPITESGTRIPIRSLRYHPLYEYQGFLGPDGQRALDELDGCMGTPIDILGWIEVLPERAPPVTIPTQLPRHASWRDIQEDEIVTPNREITFKVETREGGQYPKFWINDAPFDPKVVDHELVVGTANRWILENRNGQHPFHIHVNPFQVTEVGGFELATRMWKDTIVVPGRPGQCAPQRAATAKLLSRYGPYTGDFVLHCHILHHEDLGMMQRVRTVSKKG